MKKLHLVYLMTLLATMFIVIANSFETSSYVSGPPSGRCGDPASGGLTCASGPCHSSTVQTVSGWITSDIPASGYVPGLTYTITATATQTGLVRFGFQISPQDLSGTLVGTLVVTNTTETQILNTKYIEQKTAGSTGSGFKTWTFNWVAPTTGTGDVTFYGAFNCANNNGNSSGDNIYKTTYTISECQAIAQITSTLGNTICNNITTTLQANSGDTYQWNNGATTSSTTVSPGTYAVTVTQTGGCSAGSSIVVNGTAPPTVSLVPTNTSCGNPNGSITSNITGTGPFAYAWNNGATTQNISNLNSGSYTVTVNGTAGCIVTQSVNIGGSTSPSINIVTSDAACGQSNGTVTTNVTNGTAPYTYAWSNGATTSGITNLLANNYTLTVTDVNGCTDVTVASISDLEGPDPTAIIGNATCGNSNGAIVVAISSGAPPYSYNWNNGDSTSTLSNLAAGLYSLTVTDSLGCIANESYIVAQLSSPNIGAIIGNDSVLIDSTYTYHINPQPNSTILNWNVMGGQLSGQGNDTITVQWDSTGSHSIIVFASDTNSCLVADTLVVYIDMINGLHVDRNYYNTLSFYPNPTNDEVTFSIEAKESSIGVLSIRSMDGRVVLKEDVIIHQGVNERNISFKYFSSGSYVVQMKSGNSAVSQRLIIIR